MSEAYECHVLKLLNKTNSNYSGAPWSAVNRLHRHRTGAFSWHPVSRHSPEDQQIRLDHTEICAPGQQQYFLSPGSCPTPRVTALFGGVHPGNPTQDPTVPAAVSQYAVMPHAPSARPASGFSTEPAVTSPDCKKVFKALSASSVPGSCCTTSTSVLPRRRLPSHTEIGLDIRPTMCQQCPHLAHRKCSGISRYVANPSK